MGEHKLPAISEVALKRAVQAEGLKVRQTLADLGPLTGSLAYLTMASPRRGLLSLGKRPISLEQPLACSCWNPAAEPYTINLAHPPPILKTTTQLAAAICQQREPFSLSVRTVSVVARTEGGIGIVVDQKALGLTMLSQQSTFTPQATQGHV